MSRSKVEGFIPGASVVVRSLLVLVAALLFAEVGTHVAWRIALASGLSDSSVALFPIHMVVAAVAAGVAAFCIARRHEHWLIIGIGSGLFVYLFPQVLVRTLDVVYDLPVGSGSSLIQAAESLLVLAVSLVGARIGRSRTLNVGSRR